MRTGDIRKVPGCAENIRRRFIAPGMVDENLNVVCGKDALKIIMIKPAGSSLMDFKSFCNGRATAPGDLFMKIEK